jgi:hypothetical protein
MSFLFFLGDPRTGLFSLIGQGRLITLNTEKGRSSRRTARLPKEPHTIRLRQNSKWAIAVSTAKLTGLTGAKGLEWRTEVDWGPMRSAPNLLRFYDSAKAGRGRAGPGGKSLRRWERKKLGRW